MVVMVMSNLCNTFYRKCPYADIPQETQEGFTQTSTLIVFVITRKLNPIIVNYPATFCRQVYKRTTLQGNTSPYFLTAKQPSVPVFRGLPPKCPRSVSATLRHQGFPERKSPRPYLRHRLQSFPIQTATSLVALWSGIQLVSCLQNPNKNYHQQISHLCRLL